MKCNIDIIFKSSRETNFGKPKLSQNCIYFNVENFYNDNKSAYFVKKLKKVFIFFTIFYIFYNVTHYRILKKLQQKW